MVDRFREQYEVSRVFLVTAFLLCFPVYQSFADSLPFGPGERLVYKAQWLFFDSGRVVTEISGVKEEGRDLYKMSLHTWTTHFVNQIWTMDDYFASYWDPEIRATRKLTVKIRESTTKKDKKITFNQEKGIAVVEKDKDPPKEFKMIPGSQDFFAAGYYARMLPLTVGTKYEYPLFEDNKNYNMHVKVIKKQRIKFMGGEIDTIFTKFKLKFEGAFRSRGVLYVWFTDDKYRTPVKLKASSFFGSIILTLTEYRGVEFNIIGKD